MSAFLLYFSGGALFANGVLHLFQGMSGRAFPTPFSRRRPTRGESSARTNVLWGAANISVSYALLFLIGDFSLREPRRVALTALGAFLLAWWLAGVFGRIYGGERPRERIPLPAEREAGTKGASLP